MKLRIQGTQIPAALILSLIIASLFTFLRFNQPLWIDEGASIWFTRLPLDKLFASICEPVTPIYHLVLRAFLAFNDTEAWLRLPSLLAGLLAIFVTYRLGLEIGGRTCAGLAVVLLALQPLYSWYASEIRMHAFGESLGLLAVWLGYRAITGSPARAVALLSWVAYILAVTLALWFDYTAFLVWGLLQLVWIANGRPKMWRWIGAQAIVLLLVALRITPNQLVSMSNNLYPVFIAIRANNLGINLTPATASILLQLAAMGGVLAGLGLAVYWQRRGFGQWPLLQWIVIGLWCALVIWAVVPQAYIIKRRLIVVLPYLALATAYFATLKPRRIRRALIMLGAAATLLSVVTLQREPWRTTVQQLAAAASQQPAVIWVDEMAVPVFDYYWQRSASVDQIATWTAWFDQALPALPSVQPPPNGELWLVTAETAYRRLNLFLPDDFRANYQLLDEQHATGIGLYHYRRQPPRAVTPSPDRSLADTWGLRLLSPLDTCAP